MEKFKSYYFFIFILEIYFTISIYIGIKKCVYEQTFIFSDIFREGLYFFPSILLYNLLMIFFATIIYSIASISISSIKTYSHFSFFLFFLIIVWASFPFFYIFLTLYTPFIILAENEKLFEGIKKSYNFMKDNLSKLLNLFFPFLVLWIFFIIFQKYDKIIFLKFILIFLVSFLEILTVKTIFLVYNRERKNERNF
ncbi:MAG: hypothetical protein ACPLZ9_01960 [Candidatus Ratteibacteria bacterium]